MKRIQNPVSTCNAGDSCQDAHCVSSRQFEFHRENCRRNNCHFCLPFNKVVEHNPAAQYIYGVSGLTYQQSTSGNAIPPIQPSISIPQVVEHNPAAQYIYGDSGLTHKQSTSGNAIPPIQPSISIPQVSRQTQTTSRFKEVKQEPRDDEDFTMLIVEQTQSTSRFKEVKEEPSDDVNFTIQPSISITQVVQESSSIPVSTLSPDVSNIQHPYNNMNITYNQAPIRPKFSTKRVSRQTQSTSRFKEVKQEPSDDVEFTMPTPHESYPMTPFAKAMYQAYWVVKQSMTGPDAIPMIQMDESSLNSANEETYEERMRRLLSSETKPTPRCVLQ